MNYNKLSETYLDSNRVIDYYLLIFLQTEFYIYCKHSNTFGGFSKRLKKTLVENVNIRIGLFKECFI